MAVVIAFLVLLALVGISTREEKRPPLASKKTNVIYRDYSSRVFIKNTIDPTLNKSGNFVSNKNFARIDENEFLKEVIQKELEKNGLSKKAVCPEIQKRRLVVTAIYSLFNIFSLWLLFFQRQYLGFAIIAVFSLLVYWRFISKVRITDLLIKQIKNRPDEEFSNVVASFAYKCHEPKISPKILAIIFVPILIWCYCFKSPHFFFEDYNEGKSLRWYSIGLTNNPEVIEVPGQIDGKPVIRVRGDIFQKIKSVKEIRFNQGLEELRGQSFVDCDKLEKVVLPSSLTYIGGECFTDCYKLKSINLEQTKITEIKGETFKGCRTLQEIKIPNTVTRIGAHAFEECMSISRVDIPKSVKEIGSSAFRKCLLLKKATIYQGTQVNERAFKDSPTKIEWINN